MFRYMYVDESGDLGLKGFKYIIIACVIVDNPASFDRIIKRMRRNKFKKQLKNAHEIKASKSNNDIIKHMILQFNNIKDSQAHMIVLEKGKIYSDFLKNNKHKLYNFIAGKLAQKIIIRDYDLEIRIDKSKGKQILRDDFNKYFISKIHENSLINKINIFHSYSHSWSGIQFADIIAWACFQKFEHDNNEFLDLLDMEKREIYHTF